MVAYDFVRGFFVLGLRSCQVRLLSVPSNLNFMGTPQADNDNQNRSFFRICQILHQSEKKKNIHHIQMNMFFFFLTIEVLDELYKINNFDHWFGAQGGLTKFKLDGTGQYHRRQDLNICSLVNPHVLQIKEIL